MMGGMRGGMMRGAPPPVMRGKCNETHLKKYMMNDNLTKVRPLFTLSQRGSDNSRLLIVFSVNNIDQSISYFYATESRLNDFVIFKNNALHLKYAIGLVEIMMQYDWK